MLRREHTPHNIKKNEEEVKYKNAIDSIDVSGVTDKATKTALENIVNAIKSFKETTKIAV